MNLFARIKKSFSGSSGGFRIPASFPVDWFQRGMQVNAPTNSSVVEAAISAYAQTIAQIPFYHVRVNRDGSYTRLYDTGPSKVLRAPNKFQTRSDFMLNLVYAIQGEGNGYFYGDGLRGGSDSENMYLLDPRSTQASYVEGDIYYGTGGVFSDMAEINGEMLIPQRYVGHVKLHTPFDPLRGVSPLRAAVASMAAHGAIVGHQAAFFTNMARPSGVLSTPNVLKKEQIETLRESWAEHSKGLNAGEVPILTAGLAWNALSMSSQDAELVSAWKMTVAEQARVFRIPPMLIGDLENSSYNNAEQLIGLWLSSGLGFMVDHIEQSFDYFFDLPPNEKIEADVDVLLRTDRVAEMQELREGVNTGVYLLNEARARRKLPPVEGGDVPLVQAQMTPISLVVNPPEPAPVALPAPDPEPEDEPAPDDEDETRDFDMNEGTLKLLTNALAAQQNEDAA